MKKLCLLFLLFAFSHAVQASNQNEKAVGLPEAEKLYNSGEFDKCVSMYEKIAENGKCDDDLYYNLGNAYYRSGRIAEAVWCYEKALQINPAHEDADFNLNIIRNKNGAFTGNNSLSLTEKISSVFTLLSFSHYLIFMFISLLLLLCSGLFFLTAAEIRTRRRFFITTSILLPVFLYFITGTTFSYHDRYIKKEAIISPMSVNLKSSPDAKGMDISIVYAGNKVSIKDKAGEWMKVRTANRAEGWIKTENLIILSSELPRPLSSDSSY